jgi:hypothetical protein
MGLFSNLFKKGEDPLPAVTDPQLGPVRWSQDDEAWLGEYKGRRFGLAYEGKSAPTSELITYAHEVLDDSPWLDSSLAEAKQQAIKDYPESSHEEIKSLAWGAIHFYRHKGIRRIIADLDGGKDYRAWRIEYHDRQCEGIGFDD